MIVLHNDIKIIKSVSMTGSVSNFLVKHLNMSLLPVVLLRAGSVELCLQCSLTKKKKSFWLSEGLVIPEGANHVSHILLISQRLGVHELIGPASINSPKVVSGLRQIKRKSVQQKSQ